MRRNVFLALACFTLAFLTMFCGKHAPPAEGSQPAQPANEQAEEPPVAGTPQGKRPAAGSRLGAAPVFSELVNTAWGALPKTQSLRGQSDADVHFTPRALLHAGAELGKITHALRQDPSHIPEASDFYRSCVQDDSLADQVRAVCLRDWRFWAPQATPPLSVDESGVPDRIRDTTAHLPALR